MPDQWPSHLLPPPPLCSRGNLRTAKAKPSSHFTVSMLPSVPRSQAVQGWNRGLRKVKATVKQSGQDEEDRSQKAQLPKDPWGLKSGHLAPNSFPPELLMLASQGGNRPQSTRAPPLAQKCVVLW